MRCKRTILATIAFVFTSLFVHNLYSYQQVFSTLLSERIDSSDETLTVIVSLKDSEYSDFISYKENFKQDMKEFVKKFKKEYRDFQYTALWLPNAIIVKGDANLIKKLAKNSRVRKIYLNRKIELEPIRNRMDVEDDEGREYTYGLKKMGIDRIEASEYFSQYTGQGVVIGQIDTGIFHPSLKNIVGWYDVINGASTPYDDNDHGTHTAGTMVGGLAGLTRFGVAPMAGIYAVKAFNSMGSTTTADLLRAMDHLADPDGDPNTADYPRVINNSWGGGQGSDEEEEPLWDAVERWVDLGIFPVFSAGNAGPDEETIGTPGGFPHSFAVGASTEADTIAYFSSIGPIFWFNRSYYKPDVVAPGKDIFSTIARGSTINDGRYAKFSGTSMAAPHVAGLVALLLQAKPDLTVDQITKILWYSSKDIEEDGKDLSYSSGWGRVDAVEALNMLAGTQMEFDSLMNNVDNWIKQIQMNLYL